MPVYFGISKFFSLSIVRYIAVGGIATGTQYIIFIGLIQLAYLSAVLASLIGASVGACVAYLGQRAFTFDSQLSTRDTLPRFLVVAVVGAILNSLIVWIGISANINYMLAQFSATLIVVYMTYNLNKHWSFA